MKDTRAEVGPVQRPEVPKMPEMWLVMTCRDAWWTLDGMYLAKEEADQRIKNLVSRCVPCRLFTIPGNQ